MLLALALVASLTPVAMAWSPSRGWILTAPTGAVPCTPDPCGAGSSRGRALRADPKTVVESGSAGGLALVATEGERCEHA